GPARLARDDAALLDYRVFGLCSDGDLMEGVSAEASSVAGHLGLDNLVMVYDDNHITIDGRTEISFTEDVGKRYEAYGWYVQHVDGHSPDEVRAALDRAVAEPKRPSLIVARTHIAIGSPNKQDTSAAHGAPLGAAEIELTKKAAGWPLEPFYVADEARALFDARRQENQAVHAAWNEQRAALTGERKARLDTLLARAVPADLFAKLVAAAEPGKKDATRSLAAALEQVVAREVPAFLGGAADLAESTKTTIKGGGEVQRGEYAGRNLHFGIREHGMGAILNGLALSGFFIPFGSTFLIFSDYMRPSVRLAALMGEQVLFVYTHDSVFLGEDGPTHQAIEQLASLRLIPNLDVVRPADSLECAAAWAHALARRDGPTAFALSRQALPPLERGAGFDPRDLLKGAYIVADASDPELVLIATGSEVHVAVEAQRLLAAQGRRVRVVSAWCWEAFSRLPEAERDAILGRGLRRATLEAGRTATWAGVAGARGITIGIDRFGASAPAERIADEFGITAAKVRDRILAEL
ncbi:MAG: transketolase, partial [Sorangiineae bacterium]|nr:transketolase [Sorangiineae bacterium]